MKLEDVFGVLFTIAVAVVVLLISNGIFNAVINSDLSPFWKWVILRS